ncbi:hypothetical protein CO038_02685 [Candidatus Pacearchaeota archaeon CG_4_9_14_0_2_um_filter_39_13]|nr:hypothetical protein [Candidatus Pacearchaeota archaeon]OIO44428.1 MAG: hypothetical protein AUJ64_00095 [Candidatus Pacearchaeota archaeon CG1_02_39_14]PJC44652.1 MAG: hypothetical protein CO038_02685 [Candidatus Pacearchaeota archaeon CG_4_9_14_0_2_um_filter_39_13]
MSYKRITFQEDSELRKYLAESGQFHERIVDLLVEHEKSHYDKSRELGYSPRYEVGFDTKMKRVVSISTIIPPPISPEDDLEIALAPRLASPGDVRAARHAVRRIRRALRR